MTGVGHPCATVYPNSSPRRAARDVSRILLGLEKINPANLIAAKTASEKHQNTDHDPSMEGRRHGPMRLIIGSHNVHAGDQCARNIEIVKRKLRSISWSFSS